MRSTISPFDDTGYAPVRVATTYRSIEFNVTSLRIDESSCLNIELVNLERMYIERLYVERMYVERMDHERVDLSDAEGSKRS